ncbi:MAG: hypothetical protein K2M06_00890 [Muribaculaceae bacterium]|nr:hypothetical protein [Muribaculaceae bacterium]
MKEIPRKNYAGAVKLTAMEMNKLHFKTFGPSTAVAGGDSGSPASSTSAQTHRGN